VALVSLVLGVAFLDWGPIDRLSEGGIERWIAYPVVLWLTLIGGYLCAAQPESRPPPVDLRDSTEDRTPVATSS
jgi:hypothetical protein